MKGVIEMTTFNVFLACSLVAINGLAYNWIKGSIKARKKSR